MRVGYARRVGARIVALTAWIALAATPALARRRLIRTIDARQGLKPETVSSLAQDARGLLWFGTVGGLVRWDGQEIRAIANATLTTQVVVIRPAPDGSLYVVDISGNLFAVDRDVAVPVHGPDRQPIVAVDDIWIAGDGSLWVAAAGSVRRRDPAGHWEPPIAGLDRPRVLRGAPGGALLVAGPETVWRWTGSAAEPIAHGHGIVDVVQAPDGAVWLAEHAGRIVRVDEHGASEMLSTAARPIALVARSDQVWAGLDVGVVVFAPGQSPEVIGRTDGLSSGGPLLLDEDGSLWIGTYQGAVQLPEPDTAIYTEADGLPGGMRFVAATGEGIWAATWRGLGLVDRAGHASSEWQTTGQPCADGQGRLWAADGDSFIVRIDGRFSTFPHRHGFAGGCALARDGRVWLRVDDQLFRTPVEPGPPELFASPPHFYPEVVYEDRHGRVWVTNREQICQSPVDTPAWRCDRIPGAYCITDLQETERGTLWAATEQAGIAAWDERAARWQAVTGSLELPSRHVSALAPSPRGGTWVVGAGFVLRVREEATQDAGWAVVESLDMWYGLAAADAQDVLETADGTVWLAGFGLHRIPPEVRARTPAAPRVLATRVRVDGEDVASSDALDLPYGSNRLELWVAAMSYRDPGRIRYRVRVGANAPWSEPTTQPSFRFAALAPGDYEAEVEASLDGKTWSAEPARFVFHVRTPWWRTPWALALGLVAIAAPLWLAYRIRLAMKLRLERQRARIAMDLHDDMGSSLGSIGILASLAADPTIPERERSLAAGRIADTAEELGESLGDIVWSLRAGSSTLDALIAHVSERAARLFAGDRAELRLELPASVPALPVSLPVSRNLQLIAAEALHNAARHARASEVVLGLARVDRRRWRLWIADNGVGLPDGVERADGLGLTSMRRRAHDIGARANIAGKGGTRVEIVFELGARDFRLR